MPDAGSRDPVIRRAVVEALGTAGLVFAGAGAIVVNEVSGGSIGHLGISLTFGMIVAAMIYSTGHISGAHINPAVTLGFALSRHFPWREVPVYWGAQLTGAARPAVDTCCYSVALATWGQPSLRAATCSRWAWRWP